MKLNGVSQGCKVLLKVQKGIDVLEFETVVITPLQKPIGVMYGIVVELIKVDDKVITFDNVHKQAIITNIEDGRDYIFHISNITRHNFGSIDGLVLLSADDVSPKNYRSAVRVPICEECILQVEGSKTYDAYTRDISCTGISFAFKKDSFRYSVGQEITAQFEIDKVEMKVAGKIIREFEEGNRIILGCEFSRPYPFINKLVNKLQIKNRNQ